MSTTFSAAPIRHKARDIGFNIVGVTRAEPAPHLDAYLRWVDAGMHGKMGYLARPDRLERRKNLEVILPGAKSLILVGLDYRTTVPESLLTDPARGRIASYAWNLDYHDVIEPMLEELATFARNHYTPDAAHKAYVDTGAILERSHAHAAGMGFIGKNTMLIHPRRGSYFFLAEIITDIEFDDYDTPGPPTQCGTCTRCLVDCPTDAFPAPHILDARRCISYHTIENKGYIPHDLRPNFGNWVYGCDVCQDVCPWQRFTSTTDNPAFTPPAPTYAVPRLTDLLRLTDKTFRETYSDSPIYRIKRARLVRNACIAAGNWGHPDAIPHLENLLLDEVAHVRAHAAWAYAQIVGKPARDTLTTLLDIEPDSDARLDITQTVSNL